jgi:hypothetical protein
VVVSDRINHVVKRLIGNEWNARDPARARAWLERQTPLLPETVRPIFVKVVLERRDATEVAEERGVSTSTVRSRTSQAYRLLGTLARSLRTERPNRFRRLFRSVYEHAFGEEVTTRELTECLFGRYDRRETQTIAVSWIRRVQRGEWDLPMPERKGKSWVWTGEQAQVWRDWFVTKYDAQ